MQCIPMSSKEAHHKFITDEQPENKIGNSKFCKLRPRHGKLFSNIPHHVCICSYHENVCLLLVALMVHTAFALEFCRFIDQIACDSDNKNACSCECDNSGKRLVTGWKGRSSSNSRWCLEFIFQDITNLYISDVLSYVFFCHCTRLLWKSIFTKFGLKYSFGFRFLRI